MWGGGPAGKASLNTDIQGFALQPPYMCALADEELSSEYFVSQENKYHYVDNSDSSGSFQCQDSSSSPPASLVSVDEYYQNNSLSQEGQLLASYPGVVHTFNTSQFCLVHLKVNIRGLWCLNVLLFFSEKVNH